MFYGCLSSSCFADPFTLPVCLFYVTVRIILITSFYKIGPLYLTMSQSHGQSATRKMLPIFQVLRLHFFQKTTRRLRTPFSLSVPFTCIGPRHSCSLPSVPFAPLLSSHPALALRLYLEGWSEGAGEMATEKAEPAHLHPCKTVCTLDNWCTRHHRVPGPGGVTSQCCPHGHGGLEPGFIASSSC